MLKDTRSVDRTHQPNTLWIRRGLILVIVGFLIASLYGVLMGRAVWAERGPEITTAIMGALALFISRSRPRIAAFIGMGSVWLQLTLDIYTRGDVRGVVVTLFPLLVVTTGLLLGSRGAWLVAVVSILGIPLAAFLGGDTLADLWANNGNQGLWLLVTVFAIASAAILTSTALRSYGEVLASSEEARARYRGLFESAPDGLIGLKAPGIVIEVNAAAERLLGRERTDLIGRTIADVLAGAGLGRDVDLPQALQREQLLLLKFNRRPDDIVYVEISADKAFATGEPTLLLLRDVTQRQLIEQRIGHAQRLEAVGQLAGGIAHDFNNLLTAIGGSAELIMSESKGSVRDMAEVILEAQRRGSQLTRQLLAFARRDVRQAAEIDLAAAVRGMATLIQRLLGEQHRLEFTRTDAATIFADVAQIEQVLLNLASNSRDAMTQGGKVQVAISLLPLTEAEARGSRLTAPYQALLEVTDTGSGIPQELQAKIFEPFFTTKPRGKGTGLGLAAVQGIIKQNDGHLVLESTVGVGTTFRIFFVALPPGEGARPEGTPAAEVRPLTDRRQGRILLVDDESLIRNATRRMLEREGYEVVVAGNGEEALRCFAGAGPFHLLLTDLAMPGINGRELAERIKQVRPDLPVIFMSGYFNDPGFSHPAIVVQLNSSFLPKPFTREQLLQSVHQYLTSPT